MKVALLLSGLPRKVNEAYEENWKNIIEKYDTDVYIHCWKDEEWKKVLKTYKNAKSLQLQEPFKFTKYKEGIRLPHTDKSRPLPQYDVMSCFRQLPMFYSWQSVYRTMNDTTIDYDVIIRSRFDLRLNHPLNLSELDFNFLNHSPTGAPGFDDNICVTNKENAHTMFIDIFDKVIKTAKESGVLNSAESSWGSMVELNGLKDKVKVTPVLEFVLMRENIVWWGDENGNIIK